MATLTVGSDTVAGGTNQGLLYDNNGILGNFVGVLPTLTGITFEVAGSAIESNYTTSYGIGNQDYPNFNFYTAAGMSAPAAIADGDAIVGFYGYGYNGTAFSQSAIALEFVAYEPTNHHYTTTSNGAEFWFYATAPGTTINQIVAVLTGTAVLTLGVVDALGAPTPGSGYTNGNYTNVSLTGGHGSGVIVTVQVTNGGVSAVTITSPGSNYQQGDTLTCSAASIGGTGSGWNVTVIADNGINGELTNGYAGQLVLNNNAEGGGPIAIQNVGATGSGYNFYLPSTAGNAGQLLMSKGAGDLQVWSVPDAVIVGGYADNVNFNASIPLTKASPYEVGG